MNNQVIAIRCSKPSRKFTGHSAIYDPLGNLLLELGKYAEIKSKVIDLRKNNKMEKREKTFLIESQNLL